MLDIAFDMETSDPDDVLTLCFLATHPAVALRAVTVTPGSRQQIGLVRYLLERLDVWAPIGAKKPDHPKVCVSDFHYSWLGEITASDPDDLGPKVLGDALQAFPHLRIVTGASLGNVSAMLDKSEWYLPNIFIQGGFAGDSVVPPELRLAKFNGRETCPTFNLNGDVPAAKNVLSHSRVQRRHLISKNVCHGVVYDKSMHQRMLEVQNPTCGFKLMRDGMAVYLKKHPDGKAFHDPLAACVAIDSSVCEFREVEVYREKGEWGSRLASGTNTFISIKHNQAKFEEILSASR